MAESMYEVSVSEASEVSQQVNVKVASALLDKDINRRLRQVAKTARIKGFRPGKAPMKLIRQRYASSVRFDAIDDLVRRAVPEVLRDERLRGTIHYSRPELLTGVRNGEPVSFRFTAERFQSLSLNGHAGIAVEQVTATVADDALQAELEKLQNDFTAIVPVEDRDVVEADDIVMVTYRALDDEAEEEMQAEEQQVDLSNPGLLPGLVEGIIGATKGETKTIKLTLPENFQIEELAGEDMELELTVTEIKVNKVPEIDDELAKDAGDYENLDALKASINERLLDEAKKREEAAAKRRMLDALLAANPMAIPQGYLDEQSHREAEARLQQFRDQGLNPDEIGLSLETFVPSVKPEVSRGIHESLVLHAVAKTAELQVTEDEVNAKIEAIAEENGQPVARIRSSYNQPGMMDRLRTSMLFDKTVDWLWDSAEVTEVAELTADAEEEAPAEDAEAPAEATEETAE